LSEEKQNKVPPHIQNRPKSNKKRWVCLERKQTQPQTKSLTPYSKSNPKEFNRAEQQQANKAESSCCINVPSPNTSRDCSQNTHTHPRTITITTTTTRGGEAPAEGKEN
jgi:hypothetical protein